MKFKVYHVSILAFVTCILGLGCDGATASYSPGPIQGIGSSNELRLFLEVDRLVDSGLRHSDAPGRRPIGHKQELLIISSTGKASRHVLPNSEDGSSGRTFHPNNSAIFWADGTFYLLSFRSRDYKPTLFEWNGVRFSRCSELESTRLLTKFRLNETIIEQERIIRELEQQSGWRRVFSNPITKSDSFEWNDKLVSLDVRNESDRFVITVQVHGNDPFVTNLVHEYAPIRLTRSEVKALPQEESPHLK